MAFYRFYNILKTQESTSAERDLIDVNIYNLISSLKIIVSGLKGIKFIPRKPIYIFSSSKITKNII